MPPSNRPEADRAAEGLLVNRCRRGDPAAFEEIYRRHAPRVYSLAYRLTGSLADAEDLLQEAFLLVHRKLDSFKGDSALGTWIYRLATNCCVDFLRSRQHREEQATDTLDEALPPAPRAAGAIRVEHLDLERAIARLPPGTGRRSCCTMSRASGTAKWRRCWASPRARRNRRCTRRGCGCATCWPARR